MFQCGGSLSTLFDRCYSVTADSARDETTKVLVSDYSATAVTCSHSICTDVLSSSTDDWKLLVSVQNNLLTLGFWTFLPSAGRVLRSFASQPRSCMFFQTC